MTRLSADPITVPRGRSHARTIDLDPSPASPDPNAHYAATMAETAAMLVLVRGVTPSCGARCPTDPDLPLCASCAIDVGHLYIRIQHQPDVPAAVMAAAATRLHAEALSYRLNLVVDTDGEFVFLLLMDIARTLAGVAAG